MRELVCAPPPLTAPARGETFPLRPPNSNAPRFVIYLTLSASIVLAAAGIGLSFFLRTQWIGQPVPNDAYNVFFVLFSRYAPSGLALVIAFAAATMVCLRLRPSARTLALPLRSGAVPLLALSAFALAISGYFVVFHEYALTADENMADFQARIFLQGHLRAEVPAYWQPFVHIIMPTYASYFPALHSWNSSYLPVYSAIRALFMACELQSLVNPLFAGLSILMLAAIVRKIWPGDQLKPLLAAALLMSSSQFLLMSMTAYSMPAHLALNLVWLYLYLSPTQRYFWLTPFVGIAALGLHQPFFHALFAAPFLARLVWQRRWKTSCYFAAVYLAGIAGCFIWWHYFLSDFSRSGTASIFGLHHYTWMVQSIYLCLLLGWLAFPIPLLATLGLTRFRQLSPILQDAIVSCLLTATFYVFVRSDQAHGWGYRYFHGELGCLILVALAGWDSLKHKIGIRASTNFVVAGTAVSLFLQFPLHCFQAEKFVQPYAYAATLFHGSDLDLVAFSPTDAWYSGDLLRNDPFLKTHPIITCPFGISEAEINRLQKTYPRNHLITEDELTMMGLATWSKPR